MIATTTLHVTSPELGSMYLAPYGEAELAVGWPWDHQDVLMPIDYFAWLSASTPASLARDLNLAPSSLRWGMYEREVATANFVGSVMIRPVGSGDRNAGGAHDTQTIGTYIHAAEHRGKGLGTLAKLGAIAYAMEEHGTRAFHSYTSEHNYPAQTSLARTGFAYLKSFKQYEFPGGGLTQSWALAVPGSYHRADAPQAAAMDAGWQRYAAIARTLTITELSTQT